MLGALIGAGGGMSSSASSQSGSASAGSYDSSFQYQGAMNVGRGAQDAGASQSPTSGGLSTPMIMAIAGVIAVGILAYAMRKH